MSIELGSGIRENSERLFPPFGDLTISATTPDPRNPSLGVSTATVLEFLLKDQAKLDELLNDETAQRLLLPKLLAVAMGGFGIYGVVATVMLNLAHQASGFWFPAAPPACWTGPSAANLTLAYALGLIAANGICLPSFYFYGLLAGVRVSMVGVAAHALKGMAAGALALVGILPIYVAVSLYALVSMHNHIVLTELVGLGLLLPFTAGLFGAVSLYRGFVGLASTICESRRVKRECMLRRLILAWSGCYTFVTPLAIYSLWQHLATFLN